MMKRRQNQKIYVNLELESKSPKKIIDVFFHNISAVLSRFHFIKYEKLDIANKNKVYEVTLDMMAKLKHTQLELGNMIPNELYAKVDER